MCTSKVSRCDGHRKQCGATLIELMLFILIVSIAVAGVTAAFNVTVQASADPQRRKQALAIAEGLLEEVALARFTYCVPEYVNSEIVTAPNQCTTPEHVGIANEQNNIRPYDNVNDYVGDYGKFYTPFNVNGVTTNLNGDPVPSGYSASVMIVPEDLNGIVNGAVFYLKEVYRITIKVTYDNNNNSVTLDGYRTRYAPNLLP